MFFSAYDKSMATRKPIQPRHTILLGRMEEVLHRFPDNHFHSIVCDPPYGLAAHPDPAKLMMAWMEGIDYRYARGGFMNMQWDAGVPPPRLWIEAFRVLRPGGHALVFCGTRTQDLMGMSLRLAGFEIRDCVYWHYATGMGKGTDIAKGIDKIKGSKGKAVGRRRDGGKRRIGILPTKESEFDVTVPESEEALKWDGWKTMLKPATEPIILARKPASESTIAANVLKWGTGGLNIGDCRIGSSGGATRIVHGKGRRMKATPMDTVGHGVSVNAGRWPANFIVSHDPQCVHIGQKPIKAKGATGSDVTDKPTKATKYGVQRDPTVKRRPWVDEQGNELVEEWACVPNCAVRDFGQSSEGIDASTRATRFCYTVKPDTSSRFFWCAKCERADNKEQYHTNHWEHVVFHPTQKPVDLMEWLVKLVTPADGIVLDPFCGSGSTVVAAKQLGIRAVGIDMEEPYAVVARARVGHAVIKPRKERERIQLMMGEAAIKQMIDGAEYAERGKSEGGFF